MHRSSQSVRDAKSPRASLTSKGCPREPLERPSPCEPLERPSPSDDAPEAKYFCPVIEVATDVIRRRRDKR